ncbi:MAG: hypothetical protein A3C27_02295 [Candidatus Levybacteria bacterium RIFCSPHIGHO2_02_FULL_39_36]|nr:MAG: hypothetical protein A3C27_02295 [Candidatus Levybacteria bacterium RIFCSPHIGHO2_02_FULL_39_36]
MTKPIILNPLNLNQRRLFQFAIVFLLVLFFIILFFLLRKNQQNSSSAVILQDSKLQVFDQTYDDFDYPNKVSVHYPYILIIQPGKTLTTIYDLSKKEKKEEFKKVLLDYDGNNILYSGKQTFFNKINLGILCENGFIKSDQEVLCVAKKNSATFENELMSINTKTKLQRILYQADNLITAVSFVKEKLYIGEINTDTNASYLIVEGKKIKTQTPVNLIYPLKNQIYLASLKSIFTKNKVMYFAVEKDNSTVLMGEKIIISE